MLTQAAARWTAVFGGFRRDLPRYVRRHIVYVVRSLHDPAWLETPLLVRVSPSIGGFSLEVLPRDVIGRSLYLYGVWDMRSTRLLQGFLRPGMTMLDVGANIGYFSLLGAYRVGPAGLVQSFEPHHKIRDRLARNVARSGLANVEIRPEAVSSIAGEVAFFESAGTSNQGVSSTVEQPASHGEREKCPRPVRAVRLDDVAGSLRRRINFVKLDVEGGERAALDGAEGLLSSSDAPLLLFEAYSSDLEPINDVLQAHGFTVRRLAHDGRRGVRLARERDPVPGEPNYVAYKNHHVADLSEFM
jgi:FkbM family methyltransferase